MLSKYSEGLIGALTKHFLVSHLKWMQTSRTIRKEVPALMRSLLKSKVWQSHYDDGLY